MFATFLMIAIVGLAVSPSGQNGQNSAMNELLEIHLQHEEQNIATSLFEVFAVHL